MPHEQSFTTLFYRHGIKAHRHAARFLSCHFAAPRQRKGQDNENQGFQLRTLER